MSDLGESVTAVLVDYVSDALPAEARAEVEARLVADPAFRARAEPLLAAWGAGPRLVEDRAAGDALRRAIAVDRRRPVGHLAVGVAAVVVCAVLGVYGPGVYRIVAPVVRAHEDVAYVTGVGERRTVRLPDGSWATLGPESRLRYRASFFRAVPEVVVRGGVDFDAVRPLALRAGSARVNGGIGRFGVRNYTDDSDVRVTALDSSLRVTALDSSAHVTTLDSSVRVPAPTEWVVVAGTTAHVSDTVVVLRRAGDEGTVAWDGGGLRLVGVPLGEAVRVIRRWYGIDLRVGDNRMLAAPVTGSLPADSRAAVSVLGGRAVWAGNRVTLYARP
jgi:transmembrane sensor